MMASGITSRLLARTVRRHQHVAAACTTRLSNLAPSSNDGLQKSCQQQVIPCQQRRPFTAAKGDEGGSGSHPSPPDHQYVHPLSQIVLEHLQTSPSAAAFVTKSGLDQSLSIHKDGTFALHFPNDGGKIWTSFDPEEKKHWLTVTKGDLVGRYMLQDNKKPAWHSDRRSVPEKVQDAVDEMIKKLEE